MQYIVGTITSVELNRVRSIKTLDEFKKPLVEFLALDRASAMAVYEHEGWGEEDLDADIESVHELLDKIEHRVKSLGHYLSKEKLIPKSTPADMTAKDVSQETSERH